VRSRPSLPVYSNRWVSARGQDKDPNAANASISQGREDEKREREQKHATRAGKGRPASGIVTTAAKILDEDRYDRRAVISELQTLTARNGCGRFFTGLATRRNSASSAPCARSHRTILSGGFPQSRWQRTIAREIEVRSPLPACKPAEHGRRRP